MQTFLIIANIAVLIFMFIGLFSNKLSKLKTIVLMLIKRREIIGL